MAEPPSYDEEPPEISPDHLLKPATLHIAQRFIHPSDPNAPPLYELSHSVGFLRGSDRKVVLDRLDYSVRPRTGTVGTRKRTIYDLTHRTLYEMPTFDFQAESRSRAALGSMGMEVFRPKRRSSGIVGMVNMRRSGYRVVRARWQDRRLAEEGTLFTVVPSGSRRWGLSSSSSSSSSAGDVMWEWSDGEDVLVAREVLKDGLLSLVITAEMRQEMRDALVAAWIMRIWWSLAVKTPG